MLNIKNRVTCILARYIEQATILDPMIPDFVEPCMRFIQQYTRKACAENNYALPWEVKNIFELVYNLVNTRGFKTVIRFFPHEAADLEPCVELLHFQELDQDFTIPCVLCLWLSLIVIVPFDLQTIDSKKEGDQYEILVKRIINISREFMKNPGRIRDFSAVMLSKLMTRPDLIKQGETHALLEELIKQYQSARNDTSQIVTATGILQTLVEIFKIGHREDFLGLIDVVFDEMLKVPIEDKFMAKNTTLRKFKVKLAQRIGCIFLKPRIASWRYQRGSRTLSHLQSNVTEQQQNEEVEDEDMLEEDEIDFEKLEFIIQYLLESLKDADNVVRWAAAKGLGRITQRLTKDFGDQIVEQLHDLF